MLPLFPIFFKANELTIKMCFRVTFYFLEVDAIFTQQQMENTVMENGDKLGEDSVLCLIRQWSLFKAGP